MDWHPTPEGERITALRLIGDAWEPCQIADIRKGDLFRSIDPSGEAVDPVTLSPAPEIVALALDDARKMDPSGRDGQTYGWGVEIDVFGSFEHFRQARAN